MKALISELPFFFIALLFVAFVGAPFIAVGFVPECAIELMKLGTANGIVFLVGIVALTIAQGE